MTIKYIAAPIYKNEDRRNINNITSLKGINLDFKRRMNE
jgi:hypothetical protein